MTQKQIKELGKLLTKIESTKSQVSKYRDLLRELHEELDDILETLDEGLSDFADGQRLLGDALDKMSELI